MKWLSRTSPKFPKTANVACRDVTPPPQLTPIIEINGLGKKYRIGAHKEPYLSIRDELANWIDTTRVLE
jgi:hypothetical protein